MDIAKIKEYFLIFIVILIIRHIVLKYVPDVVFSGYVFMFLIVFLLSFYISQNIHISLNIALAVVYGRMIYRYNTKNETLLNFTGFKNTIMFAFGITFTMFAASYLVKYKKSFALLMILYIQLVYLIGSLIEWVLHKYVMHCFTYWKWLDKSKSGNFLIKRMKESCDLHKAHHISVNTDMSLKNFSEINDKYTLIFSWITLLSLLIFVIGTSLLLSYLLRLNIPLHIQGITIICFTLFFGFVWNNLHPKMHNINMTIDPLEGPGNLTGIMTNDLLLQNHTVHHQVKGENKGNFNVVFLGADELLMTNNLK